MVESSKLTGLHRVSLNWPLTAQSAPFFNRRAFHHDLYRKHPRFVNDDEWTFNSQSSSQWDGLRHFGYQKEEKFYNGVSMDEVHAVDEEGRRSTVNGIQGEPSLSNFPCSPNSFSLR